MKYQNLIVERNGHIAFIKLNRPERLNALNLDLMAEIEDAVTDFREDEQTRVVVITGEGDFFSAGFDLKDEKRQRLEVEATRLMKWRGMDLGSRMINSIYTMSQITIAAINGYAMGGGACITSACDFRIGTRECEVCYPEVGLGMNLSWGSLPLLVHLVGPARAKRMVILAKKESAETLYRWGFLDQIVASDQLIPEVVKMAEEYALMPPLATQMVKKSVNALSSALDQSIMHMDSDQFLYSISSKDHQEALQAFFEKRKPEFKGN